MTMIGAVGAEGGEIVSEPVELRIVNAAFPEAIGCGENGIEDDEVVAAMIERIVSARADAVFKHFLAVAGIGGRGAALGEDAVEVVIADGVVERGFYDVFGALVEIEEHAARERLAPSASKTKSPPQMANSGLAAAIFAKAIWQPCAASSSGWMWVSVKKTKSKEAAGCGFGDAARAALAFAIPSFRSGTPGNAAAAPAAARDCRNFLRSGFKSVPSLEFARIHGAKRAWPGQRSVLAASLSSIARGPWCEITKWRRIRRQHARE